MSADVLRQAAALMRERALSAEPGRWKTWGMDVMADPKGTSDVDDAILVARPVTPSTSERRLHTGNTDHIASWHPAVALAVADWLDQLHRFITDFSVYDEDKELTAALASGDTSDWPEVHAALAVAAAYLGTADTETS